MALEIMLISDDNKTSGERIRELRRAKGMTQAKLSKEAKIAINSLRRYESDERQPTITVLRKIADVLDVDVTELIEPLVVDDSADPEWAKLHKKIKNGSATPEDRSRYWEIIQQTAVGTGERMSQYKIRVLDNMDKLNEEGQEKVAEYADDLVRSGKHPATSDTDDPLEGK